MLASLLFFASGVVLGPESEIVIAPDACQVVQVAAAEAKTFLSQSLGADIPIVRSRTPGKTALVLGANAWADAAGVTTNGLTRDFFRIRTAPDGSAVYVRGRDDPKANAKRALEKGGEKSQRFERATVFGVYEFLERFAGVRFYYPGELGTVVPKHARIEVPETDLTEGPAFSVRRYNMYDGGRWFEGENPQELRHPMKTLNWWRYRMETAYMPCCHGQNKFCYMDRFAKSHPEYFALLPDGRRHNSPRITFPGHPGQVCHTSAIWEEIYRDTRSYLTGENASVRGIPRGWRDNCQEIEGHRYVDVMPQDGMIKCACPTCQAYYRTQPEICWASALIWSNTVMVANRLKSEGACGTINQMAYSKTRRVPEIDIPDNVNVMVAERGPFTADDPAEWNREIDEVKAWYEKLGNRKVWMWTYVHKYRKLWQPGIIMITPRAIARYFRTLSPYIFGAFMENEIDRSFAGLINEYVFAKVMWNPQVDVEALLDEYARLMFGPAAPEMSAFIARCEDIWIRQLAGKTVETADGPMSSPPSPEEMYTKVYSPEVIAEFDALFSAAESKVAADSLEGRRLALMKRETLTELRDTIAAFHTKRAAFAAFRVPAGKDEAHRILVDQVVSKNRVRSTAPVKTWARTWQEDGKLYVVLDCEEPAMDETVASVRAPDDPNVWMDNCVEVFVNPTGDRKTVYQFILNSVGSVGYIAHSRDEDGRHRSNRAWRPAGVQTSATRTPMGWRAEFAIPLTELPGMKSAVPMHFSRDRILGNGTTCALWGDYAASNTDYYGFGTVVFADEKK